MKNTFDFQDELFTLFINDVDLTTTMNITDPMDIEECDQRIKRSVQDPSVVDPLNLPMFDFSFLVSSSSTNNHLVNKPTLEFNIYAQSRSVAQDIYGHINRILKKNFEFMKVHSEGQVNSPIKDIYVYRVHYKPLVGS